MYIKYVYTLCVCKNNLLLISFRNVDTSPEQIAASLKSLEANGFINYYGMQRFGTTSVPTHTIGRFVILVYYDVQS